MKNTNYWKTIILALSIISFISCSNLFNNVETNNQNKAYLVINSVELNNSRSINPPSDEEILNSFTSISLSGSGKDSSNKTLSLSNINAENLKELYKKQILLDEGTWTFTLTAKLGSIDFTSIAKGSDGNTSISIESGKANSISFNLEPKDTAKGYGGLSVKINFDKKNVSKVKISLYKTDNDDDDTNDEVKESKEVTSFSWDSKAQNYYVSYSRAITNTSSKIEAGEYRLVFDFYNDNTCLNSIPYIVHIAEGVTTTYQQTVDINEVFTITYKGIDVSPTAYIAAGQTKVTKYSRKSEDIILPRYNRQDRLFKGWYDEEGNIITKIPHNANRNYTVTCQWEDLQTGDPVIIYVNPEAEAHYGFSEEYGLENLEAAMETIERANCMNQKHDWIIKIKGELSGTHVITTDVSNVKANVNSITLEGSTESGAGQTEPQDCLKGGITTATENGAVLSVQIPIPVIIKNLKIIGGNNSNTGDIKGGGIYIAEGSTVTLDDGALITGNSAATGAGIYNEGILKIKGSALVQANGTDVNDIYLSENNKLIIAGELTNTADTIATITPATYSTDTTVLEAESGSEVTLTSAIADKFDVTPSESGNETTYWKLAEDGKLITTEPPIIDSTTDVVVENAANIKFTFNNSPATSITRGTTTEITIEPQVELKDGTDSVPLYYLDSKVYSNKNYTSEDLISNESVSWGFTLWSEDAQITNQNYISSNGNKVTLNIPYPGIYILKVTATYLGFAHDAEFQVTCE